MNIIRRKGMTFFTTFIIVTGYENPYMKFTSPRVTTSKEESCVKLCKDSSTEVPLFSRGQLSVTKSPA